jgi:uncharacterized protein
VALPVSWADQAMRCSDGVELVARVWSPCTGGPWPVLLMRQPYGRAIASTPVYAHPSWYASQGFVVVVQDVRGCGDSQGVFDGFAQEARDSAETVLWARTLPHSNGRLGTYGFSYQGLTQLLNHDPQGRPEALPDALAPAMCGLDERRHWSASGQAHWWSLGLAWGLQLAALHCRRRGDALGWHEIRASLASQRFLSDGLALLERCDPANPVLAWLQRDPAQAEGWSLHAPSPQLLRRPLLLIGGWFDPHLEGIIDLYGRARACGGDPWLRIGAWSHLQWRGGIDRLQCAFFRRHLADGPVPAAAPLLLQDLRSHSWQRPAAQPSCCRWGLRSQGLAAIRSDEGVLIAAGRGSGAVALVHDPWRPAPGHGGHLSLEPGLVERGSIDQRSDVACFTTSPLPTSQLLEGSPSVELQVLADQPGFDLVATLAVLRVDGEVLQLSYGVERCLGASCLRSSRRKVQLQPLLLTLQPGERLRLSLAAAAWPLIAVNPGDGSMPGGAVGLDHRVIALHFDLDHAELRLDPLPFSTPAANCP